MKIGIDIHGTIDTDPEFFSKLIKIYKRIGIEIHITTGKSITQEIIDKLEQWEIEYNHIFSIIDYHKSIGTEITYNERGPWIDEYLWNKTKGDYCRREKIDLHIDNSPIYSDYFTTPYLQFDKEMLSAMKTSLHHILNLIKGGNTPCRKEA